MKGMFIQPLSWLWTSRLSIVTSSWDRSTGASFIATFSVPFVGPAWMAASWYAANIMTIIVVAMIRQCFGFMGSGDSPLTSMAM